MIGSVITKNRKEWSVFFLFLSSVVGSLVSGMGIRAREIVEGSFGFLDAGLSIVSATLFVFLFYKAGGFLYVFSLISKVKNKVVRAFLVLFFIAFPSSLTGFPLASVMTTGVVVSSALKEKGLEESKITQLVVVGSFIGALMPPNSIPAIIAANGAGSVLPTPYNGFFAPLLAISLPFFVLYGLFNIPSLSSVSKEEKEVEVFPILIVCLVVVAVIVEGLFSSLVYIGGNTPYFFLASILTIIYAKAFGSAKNTLDAVTSSMMEAVVPVAFMFALGSFIEVSSMTGVRGLYSLWILPYPVKGVILFMMALSLVIGVFFSSALPAFFITYATFPIGWLASPVVVTGVSLVLSLIPLVNIRSNLFEETAFLIDKERVGIRDRVKVVSMILVLAIALSIVFVVFGDSFLSFLSF